MRSCAAAELAQPSHSQLTPEDQLKTGVTPGYVRLSVGLEHSDDMVADLTQSLDAARSVTSTLASREAA